MWASYAPSPSVSTRTKVAPGYLASTAAFTFSAVWPVSGVSAGRGGRPGSPGRGSAGFVVPGLGVGEAALADSDAASTPPATRPAATRPAALPYVRTLLLVRLLGIGSLSFGVT